MSLFDIFKRKEKKTELPMVFKHPIKKAPAIVIREKKRKAVLGELVRVTPGKHHAWYKSNVGIIRKPYINYVKV